PPAVARQVPPVAAFMDRCAAGMRAGARKVVGDGARITRGMALSTVSGQDVDGQLVRVRVIDRDELHAGIQGISVLATRKPVLSFRKSTVFLMRLAARSCSGGLFQEPPRLIRRAQSSPAVHAVPSSGAPS